MLTAAEALARLQQGNRRFTAGRGRPVSGLRSELPTDQDPFAIVLGCSDSRVPVETIFDQGLGDLFVVRVAGNVVTAPQVGSVEFAVSQFGTRLVLVLGHSRCGAVLATLDELQRPSGQLTRGLKALVDHIRPPLEKLVSSPVADDPEALLAQAVHANIDAAVARLLASSELLAERIESDGLLVTGARYDLDSGAVTFLADEAAPA